MPRLKKKSILMVWVTFLLYGLSFSAGTYTLNLALDTRGNGLKKKEGGRDLDLPVRVLMYGTVLIATNLPDFASITIYIKIRKQLGTAVQPEEEESVEMQQQQQQLQQDGGTPSINSSSTVSSIFPDGPPPLPPSSSSPSNSPSHKVLRILSLHVCTSLVDLLGLAIPIVPNPAVRIVILHFFPVAIAFWIPMTIIKASFPQQMGNMLSLFCSLVC